MSSRGRTGEEDRTKPKPQKKKEREEKRKKKKDFNKKDQLLSLLKDL
jgi:hypothetical protein